MGVLHLLSSPHLFHGSIKETAITRNILCIIYVTLTDFLFHCVTAVSLVSDVNGKKSTEGSSMSHELQ